MEAKNETPASPPYRIVDEGGNPHEAHLSEGKDRFGVRDTWNVKIGEKTHSVHVGHPPRVAVMWAAICLGYNPMEVVEPGQKTSSELRAEIYCLENGAKVMKTYTETLRQALREAGR